MPGAPHFDSSYHRRLVDLERLAREQQQRLDRIAIREASLTHQRSIRLAKTISYASDSPNYPVWPANKFRINFLDVEFTKAAGYEPSFTNAVRLGDPPTVEPPVALAVSGQYIPENSIVTTLWQRGLTSTSKGEYWILHTVPNDIVRAQLRENLCGEATAEITQAVSVTTGNDISSTQAANIYGLSGTIGDEVLLVREAYQSRWVLVQVHHCQVDIVRDIRTDEGLLQKQSLKIAALSCDDICADSGDGSGDADNWTTVHDLCGPCSGSGDPDDCFESMRFRELVLSITGISCGSMDAQDVRFEYYDGDAWESLHQFDDTYDGDHVGGWCAAYSATGGNCDFNIYLTYDTTANQWLYWFDCYANKKVATATCEPFFLEIDFAGCFEVSDIETDCCSETTPSVLLVTISDSSNCAGLDGETFNITHDGSIWTGSTTIGGETLTLSIRCESSQWQEKREFSCNGASNSGSWLDFTPTCDPFSADIAESLSSCDFCESSEAEISYGISEI